MKPEIKKKWVEALLSGRYEQGYGKLRVGNKFCCLGVLRHVMDPKDEDSFIHLGTTLSDEQLTRSGLSTDIQHGLADDLNDCGVPFDMIAGLIDEAL